MLTVVDLFCGIGGMAHGFVKEGFNVAAGIDSDPSCRYAFEKNNNSVFINKPIEAVKPEEIRALYKNSDIKILIGCAPCQPFSSYNRKKAQDGKWHLLRYFAELVENTMPDIVSMENVPRLARHKVFKDFENVLKSNGYHVSWSIVYCPDYGIPQTRKRLVLLASKFGEIEIIKPTHAPDKYKTVRDAIGNLKKIRDGESSPKDPLHRARKLSPTNLKRIKQTPRGGSWKDWKPELVLACHKKKTGESYPDVYGRMIWDKQSPTITTHCVGLGNGRFGHPEQNRAISLREAALLQTFPKGYKFLNPDSEFYVKILARQIGNAVPVRLGQVVARSIKRHIGAMKIDRQQTVQLRNFNECSGSSGKKPVS